MNKTLLALSLFTLVASGCSTNAVHSGSENGSTKVETSKDTEALSQGEVVKINLAIARLNAELNELDELETKVYAKSLTPDKKVQKELDLKTAQYGTIETLQANIRVLISLKQDYQSKDVKPIETLANKAK